MEILISTNKERESAQRQTDREKEWKTLPQSFPVTNYYHCSVLVNSTTVWIIGGMQNNEISSNTFYFNAKTGIWTEGPPMKTKRSSPSCGQIRRGNQSQELSILVAGGFYGSQLSSVEILDLGSNEWRKGPDLPYGIGLSQMVESSINPFTCVQMYRWTSY